MAIPLRHELKFLIGQPQYEILSRMLRSVLNQDEHASKNDGTYHIRSLYFDTVYDDALYDKYAGVMDREKYRMRIYNLSADHIFMERKMKLGSLISKLSCSVGRDLADQIIAGDPTNLEHANVALLRDVYREMTTRLLRPAVIVDYVREAYVHPVEQVRITFDMQLRSGLNSFDLFNPDIPTIPVLEGPDIILEVKYNEFLPPFIADVLSSAIPEAIQVAVSKYTWCRRYEGKI